MTPRKRLMTHLGVMTHSLGTTDLGAREWQYVLRSVLLTITLL